MSPNMSMTEVSKAYSVLFGFNRDRALEISDIFEFTAEPRISVNVWTLL